MKYIIKIVFVFIAFLSIIGIVSADTENLLYKNIAITNMEIKNIYGETKGQAIVKSLDKYFIKIRAKKNLSQLTKLENRIKPTVEKLAKKKRLTSNEKKLNTLARNIYFRSKVLSDYLLKK